MKNDGVYISFDLIRILGYKEATFLCQLNYWLHKKPRWFEEKPWVCFTYNEWIEQLPLFTFDIFKELSSKLRKLGIVITSEFNKDKRDRTKWYTIDYDHQILIDAGIDEEWRSEISNNRIDITEA